MFIYFIKIFFFLTLSFQQHLFTTLSNTHTMPRFSPKEITDQKIRISKSLYAIAPWLNDYSLWVKQKGIFKGYYFNPVCFNNYRQSMSTDDFKWKLLFMIGVIYDCHEQLEVLEAPNNLVIQLCLHNPFGLSRLFFKMLDTDLGLTDEKFTTSDYIDALSVQQALSSTDRPHEDVYDSTKYIFENSPVVKDLCRLHDKALQDMEIFSRHNKTGGYNVGMLEMCLVYDLVRRVLLTMQVNCYTKEELALLNIDVSKCSSYLLGTEDKCEGNDFMFERDMLTMFEDNEVQFRRNILQLRGRANKE